MIAAVVIPIQGSVGGDVELGAVQHRDAVARVSCRGLPVPRLNFERWLPKSARLPFSRW